MATDQLLRHFNLTDAVVSTESDACAAALVRQQALGAELGLRIRIEGAVSELYDVAVLPGVRRPMAASFTGPEINDPLTFEM